MADQCKSTGMVFLLEAPDSSACKDYMRWSEIWSTGDKEKIYWAACEEPDFFHSLRALVELGPWYPSAIVIIADRAEYFLRALGEFAPSYQGALERLIDMSTEALISIERTAASNVAHVAQIAESRVKFPVLTSVKPADQKQTLEFLKDINQGEHAELATKPTTRYDATDEIGETAWRLFHFVKHLRFTRGPYAQRAQELPPFSSETHLKWSKLAIEIFDGACPNIQILKKQFPDTCEGKQSEAGLKKARLDIRRGIRGRIQSFASRSRKLG